MHLEITKEYLATLKDLLDNGNVIKIQELLIELHPADIAALISELGDKYVKVLFDYLDDEVAVHVLVELEEDIRKDILADYDPETIVKRFINVMDSDDAADIINELPEQVRDDIVVLLNKSREEEAQDLISLLEFEEDSAGGLMAKEMIVVNINDTVSECIDEIRRQKEDVDVVYTVYVVDDNNVLNGIISMKQLVLSEPEVLIRDILETDITTVHVDTSAEEVGDMMRKYDLVVLPVVDDQKRLLGRITIDDVIDVIKEEAEEDYQLISGISEDIDPQDKVWTHSRARLPWLILGLFGGIAASKVIGAHEESIQIYPEMAFFIPLITAMAGNAGVQSSAIVVQSLAAKTYGKGTFLSKLIKESSVAIINGIICSAILLIYGFFFAKSLTTAMTISISLMSVILLASVLGFTIPILLNRLKIDPAQATGPFITTLNDIIGLAVYFLIGHGLYNMPL
jgi:magnesium transporter